MLSYRHAFHASNHANVLKHAVQALIIESLKKKEKPFIVMDTHAGGGLYALRGDWSQKKAEFADGIGRLWDERAPWSAMAPYLGIIEEMNQNGELHYYPGSHELSRRLSREQDKLALMELHNNEVDDLRANIGYDPSVAVHYRDGFKGLIALLPPTPQRGLVLIDPPYELKEDYFAVVDTLKKTISFAILHFGVAFTVAYLLTSELLTASLIALIEPAVNTVAFYFHDLGWHKLKPNHNLQAETSSFALMHFSVAFGVAFLLSGELLTGGVMAMIEPAINTVVFYLRIGILVLFPPPPRCNGKSCRQLALHRKKRSAPLHHCVVECAVVRGYPSLFAGIYR